MPGVSAHWGKRAPFVQTKASKASYNYYLAVVEETRTHDINQFYQLEYTSCQMQIWGYQIKTSMHERDLGFVSFPVVLKHSSADVSARVHLVRPNVV